MPLKTYMSFGVFGSDELTIVKKKKNWIQKIALFGYNIHDNDPKVYHVKANIIFFALVKTQPKFIMICLEITKHVEVVKEQLHKDLKIILKSHTHYSLVCRWNIL